MHVAFRVDASSVVGGGHAHRCLALADALRERGANCLFVTRSSSTVLVPGLKRHDLIELSMDEPDSAVPRELSLAMPSGVDWLVVDHYGLDSVFEEACRPWARRILAVDDLANRPHTADLLLDQTPGRVADRYRGLLTPGCVVLLGADYALLRAEFAMARPESLHRRERSGDLERLLIAFGASDPCNYAGEALALVKAAGLHCRVDVVLGPRPRHGDAVRALADHYPFAVEVFDGVDDMAALLAAADLAIGAGGVAALERCCLGLPSLLVVLADNQRDNASRLASEGAAHVLECASALVSPASAAALRTLAQNGTERLKMPRAASRMCDGGGAPRVAARMLAGQECMRRTIRRRTNP